MSEPKRPPTELEKTKAQRIFNAGIFLSLMILALPLQAHAQNASGKVSVVTSYAKDVTDPIKKAFEAADRPPQSGPIGMLV